MAISKAHLDESEVVVSRNRRSGLLTAEFSHSKRNFGLLFLVHTDEEAIRTSEAIQEMMRGAK